MDTFSGSKDINEVPQANIETLHREGNILAVDEVWMELKKQRVERNHVASTPEKNMDPLTTKDFKIGDTTYLSSGTLYYDLASRAMVAVPEGIVRKATLCSYIYHYTHEGQPISKNVTVWVSCRLCVSRAMYIPCAGCGKLG